MPKIKGYDAIIQRRFYRFKLTLEFVSPLDVPTQGANFELRVRWRGIRWDWSSEEHERTLRIPWDADDREFDFEAAIEEVLAVAAEGEERGV